MLPGTAIADGFRWAGMLQRSTAHKCALQSALRTGCQSPLTSAHSSEQAELFFEGEVEDLRKEAPPEEEPQLKLSLVWLSDMFVALVSVVLVLSVVCFGS